GGLDLPHLAIDEKLLVRYSEDEMDDNFEEMIMDIDEIVEEITFTEFMETEMNIPSELAIKRAMKKAKKPLDVTVEIQATYIEIPIQTAPGERPIFPSIVIVADHHEGMIYHHAMYDEEINSVNVQNDFLNLFDQLGG